MEVAHDIALILHFIGLALIIGPFFAQMRAHSGYFFEGCSSGQHPSWSRS